ncbi:MAG: radical SAM protein [Candidatus Aminicenantes bacterium]|nr:MAG: radical SAM protein [Candidatus Aminicenantes bacterium]
MASQTNHWQIKDPHREKILLLLLPYWTPVVPPSGLSCLKGFLKLHGYNVKAVDANVEFKLREMYDKYFDVLKECVPEDKQSVFRNIGNEVWQNHMMAHLNYNDERKYIELVKILVYNTFYCHVVDSEVVRLNQVIAETYARLEKYLIDLLEREKPGILGLSIYIGTIPASLFTFRLTRQRYPHIKTVMGGGIFNGLLAVNSPNLEFFLEKTEDCIDKVIIGEGELLFLKLLRGEFPGSQRVITLRDIKGQVLDLSGVGIPDMSDFKLEYYPYLTSYASRSCPFQCSFCSDPVFWGRYRKKQAAQVAEELVKVYKTYGSRLFVMSDLLMNPIATDLSNELLKAGVSVYWDTHFRVAQEVCDPQKTLLWRRGGLYRVQLGTESGSQRVLDLMGKKITVEQIKTAISALAYAGIKTTTYWVIGHPGESEEDFQMTLDLIEELKIDIYEAETNPFWYVPNGQVADDKWHSKSKRLYPEWAKDLLIIQQWVVDEPPDRQERYARVNRFAKHCKKLGIPNPYSMNEIHHADLRWKKLHKNAVPALEEFKEKGIYIDENKRVKEMSSVSHIVQHDDNWGF